MGESHYWYHVGASFERPDNKTFEERFMELKQAGELIKMVNPPFNSNVECLTCDIITIRAAFWFQSELMR